ncbi:MAG: hypothetical protein ACXVFL_13110 [Solirubrobacteraceae bacterium]
MSSSPHTASNQAPAEPRRGGIELSTLIVAGLAAVIAAYVVSKIWAPGTVWATAFTPVIVSLVKEALERPAKRVSAVATRAANPRPLARATRTVVQPPPEADAPPPPMTLDPELTERRVYGTRAGGIQRRWKVAVITGLIAFVGVVAIFTLPELVAGRSVTSGSAHTTFFGGHRSRSSSSTTHTETTTTATQSTTTTQTTPTTTTTTPSQTTPTTTTTTPSQTTPTTTTPPPAAAPPAQTTTTPAAP